MKRILIIEDDPAILALLVETLEEEHYDILSAKDGEKGYALAKREKVDLIILDLMLPKKNGLDVCRDLRSDGIETPILMLTSKKKEVDEVVGLHIGADDYVTKPFSMPVLLAHIGSLLRRKGTLQKTIDACAFGDVQIDFVRQEGKRNGKPMQLTTREFDVLRYFLQREGEVVSRDDLLTGVCGYGDADELPTTRTVDNSILSIRKKIEKDPSSPKHLLTVHSAGYRFVK